MALTEPTTLPEFATEDTANMGEPITALKEDGWADNSIPTAKNWNWFAHWVSRWVAYFKEKFTTIQTIDVTFGATEMSGTIPTGTLSWHRCGDAVHISLHWSGAIGGASITDVLTLRKVGGGNFPDDFFYAGVSHNVPCIVIDDDALYPGYVQFGSGAKSYLWFSSGRAGAFGFFNTSGGKGLGNQNFTVYSPLP